MAISLRQSTTSQEIPLGPFVLASDGITLAGSLTILNTGIKIWKSGATTLADKNSGGATYISNGVYYCVLDATDTDTIGPLVIFISPEDALSVRVECVVLDEAVYDVMFGTTALSTYAGGAVASVTGNVGGNVTGSVGSIASGGIAAASFAAGAIDAAAIANGAIDAATFASDVDAEILSYIVDDATRIDASALNTSSTRVALALPAAAPDAAGGLPISDAGGLDLDAQRADVAAILVDTGTTLDGRIPAALVSGRMDASVGAIAANAITAASIAADAITDAKVASDVTIASVTGSVGSVTGAVGSVTGAVGSVTGNVGGNVVGSVGSVATGGIVAASIAADAFTAAKFASDVTAEFQAGLATAAALATAQADLDTLTGTDGVTLATAQANYAPAKAGDLMGLANDAITAAKFDETTAFPLAAADSGATSVARTGADADTLKTLSDQIDGISGSSNPNVILAAEIATVTNQTTYTLATGADFDDAYNGQAVVFYDVTNNSYPSVRVVVDYVGLTKTLTVDSAPDFTVGADDNIRVFATAPGTTAPTSAEVADAVWDEARAGHVASGSFGEYVPANVTLAAGTAVQAASGRFQVDVELIEGADPSDTIRDAVVDDATRIDASALNTLSSHDPGEVIMGATDLGTGTGLTAIPWNAVWDAEVQSEVQDAIEVNHLDHLLAATYDPAAKPGAADALLNELVESDAGVSRFTANALEQAPTDGAAPTASAVAGAVRTELSTELGRIDAAVSSRMATYVQPTGFLAATFPGTVASPTNITAGTITTATNVTTVNGLAANALTAAALASDAVAEIQSGLSTLDAAGVRTALGMAEADLDTQLDAIYSSGQFLLANDVVTDTKLNTIVGLIDTEVAAIKAKTDNLPAAPAAAGDCITAAGVRTAVGLASANLDTQLADLPTNSELATALAAADDAVLAAISALNNLSAAQVNAEVVDALATDTYAEPTGVPAATVSLAAKIGRLYKSLMRGIEVTATAKTFLDAAGEAEWNKALSDDGEVYTEGGATAP